MTGRSSRPSLDTADSLAVEPGGAEASAERAAEAPHRRFVLWHSAALDALPQVETAGEAPARMLLVIYMLICL